MRAAGGGKGSVVAALRDATAPIHRRLDRGLGYLLSPALTSERYRNLLEAFLGFYAPLEQRLHCADAGADEPMTRWTSTLRTPLIRQDLDRLAERDRSSRDVLPVVAEALLPRVSRPAHVLGVLYVVEGAALGGRVIAPAVAKTLALEPPSGCSFFHGSGADTTRRWRELVALLESQPTLERPSIVDAARDCFVGLETWLATRGCLE